MTTSRARAVLLAAVLLSLPACFAACGSGGSTGAGAGGSSGDGKVHPPGNGVATSEADACSALTDAASSLALSLGCLSTTQTCPDFLRSEFVTSCLQYDQGSVQGCVTYYGMQTTCADLATAVDDCAVTPIAGSAPNGCP